MSGREGRTRQERGAHRFGWPFGSKLTSPRRGGRRLRFVVLLMQLLVLLALSACGASDVPGGADGDRCSEYEGEWCSAYVDDAYSVGHGILYCYAQQVHARVRDGDISYQSFIGVSPGWVSDEEVEGRPVIADIPSIAARDTARYSGDIADSLEELGVPLERRARELCVSRMSQQVLEQKFGPLEAE